MAENYDDSMAEFGKRFVTLDSNDLVVAGIYADKPGYHNKREDLPSDDYSVAEFEADRKGPANKASAIDVTSRSAQNKNYTIIEKYSRRLIAAGQAKDPRTLGWREFFGQTDADGTVEGWDFSKKEASTSSDKSHNWHIHLSEHREFITSTVNKDAMFSILKGETLAAYKARGGLFVTDTPPPAKPPKLDVDGQLGPNTIKRWQQIMKTPVDGEISSPSDLIKAVQRSLNTKLGIKLLVDGELGTNTIKALQRYFGTPQDGVISKPVSDVVKALQVRLNNGRF